MLDSAVFLLGILSASCDASAATLLSADRQFTIADTASATRDTRAAKAAYDDGMVQLSASPWFINAKACDPPQYTFERYVVSLHSLVVGESVGAVDAITAFSAGTNMWNGITQPAGAPPNVAGQATRAFLFGYPDLFKQMSVYDAALRTTYNAAQAIRHAPSSAKCAEPNIPADYVRDSPIYVGTFLQGFMQYVPSLPKGRYEAVVNVALDGAGTVQGVQIAASSGNRKIDDEALDVAKGLHYLPQVQDCHRVPSTYAYHFSISTTPDTGLPPGVTLPGVP